MLRGLYKLEKARIRPWSLQKEHSSADMWILAQGNPFCISDFQNRQIGNLCCFKPPCVQ